MIQLKYNNGFIWKKHGNINYKGYFEYDEEFTSESNILKHLHNCKDYNDFVSILKKIDGCFAIIIEAESEVWAAVDLSRSFPIFYSKDGNFISDCSESIRKAKNIEEEDVDPLLLAEMLMQRNTRAGHTVYEDILQLQAGEACNIRSNNIKVTQHFSHLHKKENRNYNDLKKEFHSQTEKLISSMKTSIGNKKVVVPLSGGYDSRMIVTMLKEAGIENVICFTYGREQDYEVQYSKKIAEKLDYDWYFVEYTERKWQQFFDEKNIDASLYFENTHNHCNLPHIQEYIALNELSNKKIIDKDMVVIPGFCGDAPAGSFSNIDNMVEYNNIKLANYIYSNHFVNFSPSERVTDKLIKELIKYFDNKNIIVYDRDTAISAYEEWAVTGRITMWVVNSLRVYEHFGLEWRIPMWNKEYLVYWYSVPNEYRKDCVLYIECLFEKLFLQYGVTFKKPNISKLHQSPIRSIIASSLKYLLIKISLLTGKDIYRRNNLNSYNQAAITLFKKIKNKKIYMQNSLSAHLMEQLWWCELRYGSKNIIDLMKK